MIYNYCQRFAACRSGELRNRDFSAKIKFLAKDKREFTTFFAIFANRCCAFVLYYPSKIGKSLPDIPSSFTATVPILKANGISFPAPNAV